MTERLIYKECYFSNGKFYILESDPFEPREKFNKRSWFIIKYIEDNKLNDILQSDLDNIIKKSRIWMNQVCYGAKYK